MNLARRAGDAGRAIAQRPPVAPPRVSARRPTAALALLAVAMIGALVGPGLARARRLAPGPVTAPAPGAPTLPADVTLSLDQVTNAFRPDRAIGAGVDGHGQGEVGQIYTPTNLRAMRSAGFGSLTYRLRTELGVEAWHPGPDGTWSDGAGGQGYWTPSSRPRGRPAVSSGYSLPRRGNTVDQANDTGYSRLDDGNPATFWKSNPYLDSHYTGEADRVHPQWVLIDLRRPQRVDGLQIDWYAPYATRFVVQYWVGPSAVLLAGHPPGHWADFPRRVIHAHGASQPLRISPRPLRVRFVRVLMSASSHTAPAGSRDVRDRLGYAIREIHLGRLAHATRAAGQLQDLIQHAPTASRQTTVYTSSTDPWHRARDRDPNYEQPSFQTVAASGLSRGLPVLVPVSVLYGTPQAAIQQLRYLKALHIPLRGVELGEEPDGQLAQPEDYGALYLQFARAIHRAFPGLPVGGPGLQTSIPDWQAWPDRHGDRAWLRRFVRYLDDHGGLSQLGFFSFEWYPFDNACSPPGPQLARASQTLAGVLALQRTYGLPAGLPIYITEYGYSAFAGQAEVDLPGALLEADTVARFLTVGGTTAYLYGYEPDSLMRELPACDTWGNLAIFQADDSHRMRHPLAAYWAARLLTRTWTQPGDGLHELYAASSTARDGAGQELVRAYPLRRPDGRLSILLLNLDPAHAYDVHLHTAGGASALSGPLDEYQLSAAQYVWHARRARGYPSPDQPPAHGGLAVRAPVHLPAYSLTVVSTGGRASTGA